MSRIGIGSCVNSRIGTGSCVHLRLRTESRGGGAASESAETGSWPPRECPERRFGCETKFLIQTATDR